MIRAVTSSRAARLVPAIAGLIGVCIAFGIVVVWFPSAVWDKPIQGIDAPAHYYFIRKILKYGPSTLLSLLPNEAFYPPLFHIFAVLLVLIGSVLGITIFTGSMAAVAATNCIWLLGTGILWPLGMLLLCAYFFRKASLPTRCLLSLAVPILSVCSGANPYQMLYAGPLIAYGFASNLLPFLLLATLRLLDVLTEWFEADAENRSGLRRRLITALVLTALTGALVALSQPKMAFTYIVLMLPFVLVRMPWKLIAGVFAALIVGAIAFVVFATYVYPSTKYLHPETWFHTHEPSMDLRTSLTYAFTDGMVSGDAAQGLLSFNVPTVAGWAMIVLLLTAIVVSFVRINRDGIALLLAFALVLFIFECGATFTGAIPNIVTAVWYRNEVRTMTMLPFAILPLIAFACARLDGWVCVARQSQALKIGKNEETVLNRIIHVAPHITICVCAALMSAIMVAAQVSNPVKTMMRDSLNGNASLDKTDPNEQLTHAKLDALTRMTRQTGTEAVVISDPLNGSMYATALFGANMLFPVYNPQGTFHGQIFGQVEQAFASGNSDELLNVACGINPEQPTYFLSMGPQAASLQMFTYKAQYDQFHDATLIQQYADDGTMSKIEDFSSYGDYAQDWALYQLQCPASTLHSGE